MTDQCIHHLIAAQAKRTPDAIAIAAPGRTPLTYSGLRIHIEDTVETLNAMSVGRNDRVAIVLPNGPEMAVAFLAVASGATSAPLNPAYRANEFDFYLSDLNAKALIIQPGMDSPAIAVAQARGIPTIELLPALEAEAGIFTLKGDKRSRAAQSGFAQPDDVALVLHTSGTTSRPKIVPLTQTNIYTSAHNIRVVLALANSDRCLNVMPLFHIHGLMAATLSSLVAGASLVCTPGFYAPKFFEWMDEFRPTWYTAVPTMHQAILARAASNREIIARCPLRFVRSSSSSLPPQVMAELESVFDAPAIEVYGMTEASHQMTSNPLPPRQRKPGSVGVAAGPEVAIMDEAGNLLPPDETGEIVIRGANVTPGYENSPTANASAFTNGWFRTGDQGFMDNDGYLFITGRLKEIINRGGEKISPREVDEALLNHPAVAQAVTFAVPHATLGEDVAAAVVLQENASVTEREIRELAFARLADYKVPSQVVIVDEIPKGPTGKLQRIGLADKLAPKLKAEFVAPRDPVEDALASIWAEVLGIEQVGIYDNFFALGGDSFLAVRLFAQIEKVFGKNLPLATLFQAPTIEQLVSILRDEGSSPLWPSLVPIQPKGSKQPFFCIHAHSGQVLQYRDLALHLGPDQPFYGLQARLDGKQPYHTRIEDMAAHYIREIRTIQPEGPYSLGGHCFGGTVAFEMAQQLHVQGQKVALLVLFDARRPGQPSISLAQRMGLNLNNLLQLGFKEKLMYILDEARAVTLIMKGRIENRIREPSAAEIVGRAHIQVRRNYVAQVYPGRMILFRNSAQPARYYLDPYLGWGGLAAGGIEVHKVPVKRVSMLKEPYVRILAERLTVCFDKAQADDLGVNHPS